MSNALRIAHGAFGRVALLDMDASLVRHAHPHCHVLIKAEGSDTQFSVRDQIVPLTTNNAVLINAWEPHAYVHDPRRTRTIILALYIEPIWLAGFRKNWTASGAPGFFERLSGELTPLIRSLADELAFSMTNSSVTGAEQERLLSDLMIAVIEKFSPWREVTVSLRDLARRGSVDWRIRRALEVIRANPGEIGDMSALAREVGLSRAHFFRLFEKSIDVPPRVFLNVVRLEYAVGELVNSEVSLSDLSDRLGFSAPPHFTRFFRDHAGATPSEFRSVARQ
ncbi:transcriptional regulator [Aliidongia dinghuensis]|uniref:Transcriptional regulator n=1 Tax=Aliidongia dinghuensis TaxID=1867774 RepID=A0A8J2YQ52_9PROT|nr:AraC family transcriptional regulator [Aliidongia dinghuensis]GGF00751.1 transcriptional regulator [Aliidongia dinghuensis]